MGWHSAPELFEVHIRRMSDGVDRVYRDVGWIDEPGEGPSWPEYIWTEGNFSCDCNRAIFFARAGGESEPGPETTCGESAFRIAKVVKIATGEVLFSEIKS